MLYFDNTIWLIIVAAIIAGYAQIKISSTFSRYSKEMSDRGIPAYQVARSILDQNGLTDVNIERIAGNLTDHYDPRSRVLRLSQTVFNSNSVAAIGVAAHEVGHAIQHQEEYLPLKVRNALVPVATFSSNISWFLILIGIFMGMMGLLKLGILLFSAVVLFQLVTLPVEFNASGRALAALEGGGYLSREETGSARKVLSAAALTYVAAVLVSIAQLLRLILITRGRDE